MKDFSRCPSGKVAYSSLHEARQAGFTIATRKEKKRNSRAKPVSHGSPPHHPEAYYCRDCGWYHFRRAPGSRHD